MKLNINNHDLLILKRKHCEECYFNNKIGFCIYLHLICIIDHKIFIENLDHSSIFKL